MMFDRCDVEIVCCNDCMNTLEEINVVSVPILGNNAQYLSNRRFNFPRVYDVLQNVTRQLATDQKDRGLWGREWFGNSRMSRVSFLNVNLTVVSLHARCNSTPLVLLVVNSTPSFLLTRLGDLCQTSVYSVIDSNVV